MNSANLSGSFLTPNALFYLNRTTQWFFTIILGTIITIATFIVLPNLNYNDPKNPEPIIEIEFMPWVKSLPQVEKKNLVKKVITRPKPVIPPAPKPKPISN